MVANYLDIFQIVLLLGVITFLAKLSRQKPAKHRPHIPGEPHPSRTIITPSGNITLHDKLKPKTITDDMLVEREDGH